MNDNERSRLHGTANSEGFALRRAQRRMAAGEKALERELEDFGEHLDQVEQQVEAEVREGHWGSEPERPLSWTEHSLPDNQ